MYTFRFTSQLSKAALVLGLALQGAASHAGCGPVSTTYLGTVCWTASSFCPQGYSPAEGQILQVSANAALYSLLGATYGGNAVTSFALPDLRGRTAVNWSWPEASALPVGLSSSGSAPTPTRGAAMVTLTANMMPAHDHVADISGVPVTGALKVSSTSDSISPVGNYVGASLNPNVKTYASSGTLGDMKPGIVSGALTGAGQTTPSGNSSTFDVRSPRLITTACILTSAGALYPPRP
ncbi:Uncharacterised protein [BD1-7 clade bacterium]|uniref:Phage tail collar domain-containing protein n=1 Tax=BD1-7 clade bacterium TaxID=2029982 RepID=A0A5S9PGT0_9GAMM|nr:Uncharacterised protein [BD1-7 clade bacterium]CAA0103189.1 Uncharacterised protein [BD1-7 clade bacterium]